MHENTSPILPEVFMMVQVATHSSLFCNSVGLKITYSNNSSESWHWASLRWKSKWSMEPVKPNSSDCCGSGCVPCIIDVYEAELRKWKEGSTASVSHKQRCDLLSTLRYQPFRIFEISFLAQDIFLFRFQASAASHCSDEQTAFEISGHLPYRPSQHLIMRCPRLKTSGFQSSDMATSSETSLGRTEVESEFISRAYTPISLADEENNCCFDTVIKLYENGLMSSVLRTLQRGHLQIYFLIYLLILIPYQSSWYFCILVVGTVKKSLGKTCKF